jgi:hypothetical protein
LLNHHEHSHRTCTEESLHIQPEKKRSSSLPILTQSKNFIETQKNEMKSKRGIHWDDQHHNRVELSIRFARESCDNTSFEDPNNIHQLHDFENQKA